MIGSLRRLIRERQFKRDVDALARKGLVGFEVRDGEIQLRPTILGRAVATEAREEEARQRYLTGEVEPSE